MAIHERLGPRTTNSSLQRFHLSNLIVTCNHPSVEVERHFPRVLKDDWLEEMTVSLKLDLLGFTPGSGVEET